MTKREPRYTEAEWRDRDDLRKHWAAFCDADPFEGSETFIERMDSRRFIRCRPVKKRDLDQPFAYERGIEPGGMLWELTKKGQSVLDAARGGGEQLKPDEGTDV